MASRYRINETPRKGHLLKDGRKTVQQNPAVFGGDPMDPRYLVIHYTGGSSLEGAVNWFLDKRSKASAHLVIGTDGEIVQCVPFDREAWHAGKSFWDGVHGLNSCSIGIEVVNPGKLEIVGDGVYRTWWGEEVDQSDYPEVFEAEHENGGGRHGWVPFTPEQNRVLLEVGSELMTHYDLLEAVGHDQISPGRKFDPGPCMSKTFYSLVEGRDDADPLMVVHGTAGEGLAARKNPHHEAPEYSFGPLPDGTKVTREEVRGKWARVKMIDPPYHECWSHAGWLRRANEEETRNVGEPHPEVGRSADRRDKAPGPPADSRMVQRRPPGQGRTRRPRPLSRWRRSGS